MCLGENHSLRRGGNHSPRAHGEPGWQREDQTGRSYSKSGRGHAETLLGSGQDRIHMGRCHFFGYRQPLQLSGWTKAQVRGCKCGAQGHACMLHHACRVVQQTVVGSGQTGAYAPTSVSMSFKKNMESEIHTCAHWVVGEQPGLGGVGPPVRCAHSVASLATHTGKDLPLGLWQKAWVQRKGSTEEQVKVSLLTNA